MESQPPPAAPLGPASLRRLLALAWPIIVSRSSQVVVGVSDAVMVAGLGEAALAATTTGALNTFNLLILPMGVVFIVSSFSSQLAGKGDARGARRYGWYGLAVALAAQAACLATLPLVRPALGSLGYAPEVLALMAGYIQLRLLTGGAAIGMEALANYYGGLGNTRLPMLANVAAMVLNVIGNWILIWGHLGAPAMGVRGAALASALSTLLAFAGLFACFLLGVGAGGRWTAGLVQVEAPADAQDGRLSWRELFAMLRFGLPSGLNWFLEFSAFSFFINVVVAGLGTTTLAALMAVMQINSVSFMPAFGLASAGAILVGQEMGAGAHDRVPGTVRLTLLAAAAWEGAAGLAYLFLPHLLMRPFLDDKVDSSAFLSTGARMLMLSTGWQLFDAAATTLAEALRGAGDTVFPLWLRVAIAWLVFVPGVWISVRHLGGGDATAILWFIGYIALLALALWLRFRSGAWRRFDLTRV